MAHIVRRRVFVFISAVLLILLIVPCINYLSVPSLEGIKWKRKAVLYNMDFASRWLTRHLYPLGISTDPRQVIIGRDDWLFLGDQYEQTLSVDRRPPSAADLARGQEIAKATQAWDTYLASKGVKLLRIMIGPNKGTIYPEQLPFWAKPASPNATDALLAATGATNYVDLRAALLAAKTRQPEPLYYKTDTHWNAVGGAVAFQAFAQQVRQAAPEIKWPAANTYALSHIAPREGGDLAFFLRLAAELHDAEPVLQGAKPAIKTIQSDFDSGEILLKEGSPYKPTLLTTSGALNNKKVLWLRDSFGNALQPLMATTFSDILHLHWQEALQPGGRLLQLVEEWQPDYVFITVVERAARSPLFAAHPPAALALPGSKGKPMPGTAGAGANPL